MIEKDTVILDRHYYDELLSYKRRAIEKTIQAVVDLRVFINDEVEPRSIYTIRDIECRTMLGLPNELAAVVDKKLKDLIASYKATGGEVRIWIF